MADEGRIEAEIGGAKKVDPGTGMQRHGKLGGGLWLRRLQKFL